MVIEHQKKEGAPAKNNSTQTLQEGLQQEAKNPWCPYVAILRMRSLRGNGSFFLCSLEFLWVE